MSVFISLPQFPNVPDVPGVPVVQRALSTVGSILSAAASAIPLLTTDVPGLGVGQPPPTWGLFDSDGNPVIIPDVIVSVEYKKEFRISDYPVAERNFASYNKVAIPFSAKITFAKGGDDTDRNTFLTQIDDACQSLDLYTLVMPDISYDNVNVMHYDYQRTKNNGVTLLQVDVWVEEVRIAPPPQFSNAGGAPTVPGTQATTTPDPAGSGGGVAPVTGTPISADSPQTQEPQQLNPQNPASQNPSNDGDTQAQSLTAAQKEALCYAPGYVPPNGPFQPVTAINPQDGTSQVYPDAQSVPPGFQIESPGTLNAETNIITGR